MTYLLPWFAPGLREAKPDELPHSFTSDDDALRPYVEVDESLNVVQVRQRIGNLQDITINPWRQLKRILRGFYIYSVFHCLFFTEFNCEKMLKLVDTRWGKAAYFFWNQTYYYGVRFIIKPTILIFKSIFTVFVHLLLITCQTYMTVHTQIHQMHWS